MKIISQPSVVVGGGTAVGAGAAIYTEHRPEEPVVFIQGSVDDGGSSGAFTALGIPAPGDSRKVIFHSMGKTLPSPLRDLIAFRFKPDHELLDGKCIQKATVGDLIEAALSYITGDRKEAVRLLKLFLDITCLPFPVTNLQLYPLVIGKLVPIDTPLCGMVASNAIIAALYRLSGDNFPEALRLMCRLCRVRDTVQLLPVTIEPTILVAQLKNGNIIRGESAIEGAAGPGDRMIENVWLDPVPSLYGPAKSVLLRAKIIAIWAGSYWQSTVPPLLTRGFGRTVENSSALLVQVVNLMTTPSETHDWRYGDYIDMTNKILRGRCVDYAICNDFTHLTRRGSGTWQDAWREVLLRYEEEGSFPVLPSEPKTTTVVRGDFASLIYAPDKPSIIRHNANTIKAILELL